MGQYFGHLCKWSSKFIALIMFRIELCFGLTGQIGRAANRLATKADFSFRKIE